MTGLRESQGLDSINSMISSTKPEAADDKEKAPEVSQNDDLIQVLQSSAPGKDLPEEKSYDE